MIKFRCDGCHKKMGVPDDYAGKRVRCPQCHKTVIVPSAAPATQTQTAADSPVRSSGDHSVPLEAIELLSPQDEENRLVWTDDLLKPTSRPIPAPTSLHVVPPPIPSVRKCPKCGTEVTGTANLCGICGCYVGGGNRTVTESDQKPKRTFFQDLFYLLSPIHSVGDAIKLFFLIIITIIMNLTVFFASFILISGIMVICGYWCAYMFSIVVETAGGDDELPEFPGVLSFWEDILHPLLLWIASFIYAFLPMIVMAVYYEINGLNSGTPTFGPQEKAIVFGLSLLGLFFWPMILLGLSLGESLSSVRPDFVLRSIANTFLPYLICCLCLCGCFLLWNFSHSAMAHTHGGTLGGWIAFSIAGKTGGLCLWIYAMRTMGLLYRHYQHKLVW